MTDGAIAAIICGVFLALGLPWWTMFVPLGVQIVLEAVRGDWDAKSAVALMCVGMVGIVACSISILIG